MSEFPDNSDTVSELEMYRLVKISSAVIFSFLLKHHQPNLFYLFLFRLSAPAPVYLLLTHEGK